MGTPEFESTNSVAHLERELAAYPLDRNTVVLSAAATLQRVLPSNSDAVFSPLEIPSPPFVLAEPLRQSRRVQLFVCIDRRRFIDIWTQKLGDHLIGLVDLVFNPVHPQ